MKKLLTLLLFAPLFSNAQLLSFIIDSVGVLYSVNPSTGQRMRILDPAQLKTNFTDSIGFGTVADSRLTVSNVKCLTCPSPQLGTLLHTVSEGTVNGRTSMDSYNSGGAQGSIIQGRRGRGTANSPTYVLKDDILFALGADGFPYHNISIGAISIKAATDFNTSTSAPTYMAFTTTDSGSVTPIQRAILNMKGIWQWTSYGAGVLQSDALGNITSSALQGTDTTSLSNRINSKYATPTGSASQYIKGDGALASFPAIPDTTSLSNRINAKQSTLFPGTGISIISNTVTNTAPDQTVSITPSGYGFARSGTYPNFTLTTNTPTFNNAPSLTLNSSSVISATNNARVNYTVSAAALVSIGQAIAYLEISSNNSTWVTIASAGETSVALLNTKYYNIQGEVPAGWYRRIRTSLTGGGAITFISGQEVTY